MFFIQHAQGEALGKLDVVTIEEELAECKCNLEVYQKRLHTLSQQVQVMSEIGIYMKLHEHNPI